MIKFIDHNYPNPVKKENRTELEVDKWVISEFICKELIPLLGTRPYPLDELILLTSIVCWCSPFYIFDLGTHLGKSARIFYEISKYFKIKYEIYTIDLPDEIPHVEHPGKNRGFYLRGIKQVIQLQGSGLTVAIKTINNLENKSNLLFYLDDDHEYSSVKHELFTISRKYPTSVILVHDTFYQSRGSKYNIGPYLAIQQLIKHSLVKYKIFTTNTGLPGLTALIPVI